MLAMRSARAIASIGLGAALVAVALSGCTSDQAGSALSSRKTAKTPTHWPALTFTGTGQTSEKIDIPQGAQSMRVAFACTDVHMAAVYNLLLNPALGGDRSGGCGHLATYTVDVATTFPQVNVTVDDTTSFAMTVTFLPTRAAHNQGLAANCDALSKVGTAIQSADQGYAHHDVTAVVWAARMKKAASDLRVLEPTTGMLHGQLAVLTRAVTAPDAKPGDFAESGPSSFNTARHIIEQLCEANGSPVQILEPYGG
jgi:hypothetical protein